MQRRGACCFLTPIPIVSKAIPSVTTAAPVLALVSVRNGRPSFVPLGRSA
jgi:hypothetical protein